MTNEVLSICIPTYNRASHLEKLLEALNIQLKNIDEKIVKIYISDNCSTDNTEKIISKYTNIIPELQYTRNKKNIGMMNNFVKLFEEAKGDYIWLFGDDDEFVTENSLKKLIQLIIKKQADYFILLSSQHSDIESGVFYSNISIYIDSISQEKPDALRCHTWITANIIRNKIFDLNYAINKIPTFYMHMYGIMEGMFNCKGNVFVISEELVRPCEMMGYREGDFPNLRLKWI